MKRKAGLLAVAALAAFGVCGCSTYTAATNALNAIGQIISLAQTDLPALEAAGTIPAADVPAVTNWLAAAATLKTQASSCVTSAGTSGTKAALGNCLFVFANGLTSPAELAELRILSPSSVKTVELWAVGFTLAADGYCAIEGCTQATPPVIQSAAAPTTEELHDLRVRAGLPPAFGY
jgi:hypothetical protein